MEQELQSDGNEGDPWCPVGMRISELLERMGVQQRQRVRYLASFLGIDYQATRRRMAGKVAFELNELARLGEHLNESFLLLVSCMSELPGVAAMMDVEGSTYPCTVWLGAQAPGPLTTPWMALPPRGGSELWTVVPGARGHEPGARCVARVLWEPAQTVGVIVVEDDDDQRVTLVDFFQANGVQSTGYSGADAALAGAQRGGVTGFVVDWILGRSQTSKELLASFRLRHPSTPMVILTGQIGPGNVNEDELAAAAKAYDATVIEKPARGMSVLSALRLSVRTPAKA